MIVPNGWKPVSGVCPLDNRSRWASHVRDRGTAGFIAFAVVDNQAPFQIVADGSASWPRTMYRSRSL